MTGLFWAFDVLADSWVSFSADDNGQYPWGRNRDSGSLASSCNLLAIDFSKNYSNCCLFIHLLIGILGLNLISTQDLFKKHEPLLRQYLESRIMRSDVEVVPHVLDTLNLQKKLFVRFIFLHSDGLFYMCSEQFGDSKSQGIYIAHSRNHFFLALPFSAPH